jgi:hypothetical protein
MKIKKSKQFPRLLVTCYKMIYIYDDFLTIENLQSCFLLTFLFLSQFDEISPIKKMLITCCLQLLLEKKGVNVST